MKTPGFYPDIPEADYHADQDSLSVSGAKVLLSKSPAHFRHQLNHPQHKDAFDFGSAAHALVLGRGMESIYVAPYDDWTKRKGPEGGVKYTTDEKRIAREDGLSPILAADWLTVCDMADELSRHRKAMDLLSEGQPEVSAYIEDAETGVTLRCRYDWLRTDLAVDYKSAVSSKPSEFIRAAVNFGYHQQHSWYLDLGQELGHTMRGFVFIAQEKTAPYVVTVIELPPELVEAGRDRNRVAIERFRDCTDTNLWPGYVPDDRIATHDAPRWAFDTTDLQESA